MTFATTSPGERCLLGDSVLEAKDDLDLQQAIQGQTKRFLEVYNADENVTTLRVGKADRGEGARVRAAKNEIFDDFLKKKKSEVTDGVLDEFVAALLRTFQYPEITNEERRNVALVSLTTTALQVVLGSALERRSEKIAEKLVDKVGDEHKASKEDREKAWQVVEGRLRVRGFLERTTWDD